MNVTQSKVLRYFLGQYQTNTDFHSEVSSYFQNFFTHSELQEIVRHIYGESQYDTLNLRIATSQELLEHIGSDQTILTYYLSLWDTERKNTESQSGYRLAEILAQLQLEGHYLLYKPIEAWDEYDKSNFRNLQHKAGKIQTAYGIYASNVNPHKLHTAPQPKRFYETRKLAEEALSKLGKKTHTVSHPVIYQVSKST